MEIEMSRNHDVKVLLRADKNSQHGDFVFVLDQLKALGIHRISIATDSN
jgi:biopolymer transport protein ExbD